MHLASCTWASSIDEQNHMHDVTTILRLASVVEIDWVNVKNESRSGVCK